jgi:hypothetical protein
MTRAELMAASTEEDDDCIVSEDPGERCSIRRRPLEFKAVFAAKMATIMARWISMLEWRDSLNQGNAPTHWGATFRRFDDYLSRGLSHDMDAEGLGFRLVRFFDYKCKVVYTKEALLDCINLCFGLVIVLNADSWSIFLHGLGPQILSHINSLEQAHLDSVDNDAWCEMMTPIVTSLIDIMPVVVEATV